MTIHRSRVISVLLLVMPFMASLCQARQVQESDAAAPADNRSLQQQVSDLTAIVEKLQARVDQLEKESLAGAGSAATASASATTPGEVAGDAPSVEPNAPSTPNAPQPPLAGIPDASATPQTASAPAAPPLANVVPPGTTINFFLDAYYEYNFNQPIGRVNLLRPYDVLSNAFSINQAGFIFENAADPDNGKRWGLRLDFQYGQATQTLQGNPQNEPRPEIYRNIFQAYGTYVAPIGKGLTIDIGKFASSLGYEGNYTKDQMNYSRSFWFAFLPFYHLGLRANYKFNDVVAINYWMVNGTNQSEPFNGFKDEYVGLAITPEKNFSWSINYYLGMEHPDAMYYPNGGAPPNAPTLQGTPFEPIPNSPTGKLHIFDTYLSWQPAPKWTFVIEADDEIQRLYTNSYPEHTDGGAVYLKYQLTPKFYLATRAEYLSDAGRLYTGVIQRLGENTVTAAYRFGDGFQVMGEWRRDHSNHPFFYTNLLEVLKNEQNTATMGFLWWFGGKQGAW